MGRTMKTAAAALSTLSALLLAVGVPATAAAQVIVGGKGNAADCYSHARTGNQGSSGALRVCSDALLDGLSRRDEASTHVNRGILYMRRGDHARAVEDYEAAIALRPNLSESYINYGAALFYMERDAEALEALNRALALDTDREPEALYNRALVHDRAGDYKSAYRDLTRALELKPGWEPAERVRSRYQVRSR